ncbi:sugar phosphate isomerase/epimerase [Haloactinopolyspora alba]|uniref:Sugar phosphate isomerase/epimerase n=1 Tax=Haloactinopolyspora alba TaxID=648780 RepID=A0A2P8DZS8_9ACTN|nr:sugar phosphate isomerase/epimerase family protein [Haloactinopolyspora alba]PSL02728.1 sugar phosphate isomerase/epimerase [Haloactinopolyspora alba]
MPHRLSLNQKTTNSWPAAQAVDGCARAGIESIGLWREPVHEAGVAATARRVADAGLRVSSLCRGGFLTALPGPERDAAVDDNRRAIDEAAELSAGCLVMVVGGLPDGSRDLAGARQRVADGIAELVPYAASRGVRLALEPMHPLFCADRGVLSTLDQALEMAAPFAPETVGVVVDTFHVWWDPRVDDAIARSAGRIASFQVCDWITPFPSDALLSRGMMGDGHIDFRHLRRRVEAAGYDGDIEVEIFNAELWNTDPDEVLALMRKRYTDHVLEPRK